MTQIRDLNLGNPAMPRTLICGYEPDEELESHEWRLVRMPLFADAGSITPFCYHR